MESKLKPIQEIAIYGLKVQVTMCDSDYNGSIQFYDEDSHLLILSTFTRRKIKKFIRVYFHKY